MKTSQINSIYCGQKVFCDKCHLVNKCLSKNDITFLSLSSLVKLDTMEYFVTCFAGQIHPNVFPFLSSVGTVLLVPQKIPISKLRPLVESGNPLEWDNHRLLLSPFTVVKLFFLFRSDTLGK
jgi:hypothetical protein